MADTSRNSFQETENTLNDLRGLGPVPQPNPRHYVSLRLQQGVPLLDADWNEQEDIRRIELETVLAKAIGSGVPAGSDGFRISQAVTNNNFMIAAGLLFMDGWLLVNPSDVGYNNQSHRQSSGVAPAPPPDIQNAPIAQRELVYLDAWEREVGVGEDSRLVDPNIGVETCVRLERAWVVRTELIPDNADPLDPATIPNRQPLHRYYPLATLNRDPGGVISDRMLADLRRLHLTLDALSHAPLQIYDPVRDQALNAQRLADAFAANLLALDDVFRVTPDAFVFVAETAATWGIMTVYQDLRALAVALREQALRDLLHPAAAMGAMQRFFNLERGFSERLQQLTLPPPDGISAGESTAEFLGHYNTFLLTGPDSLATAVEEGDLLGAVLAQERINQEISQVGGSRLDGTVSLSLIAQSPSGVVTPDVIYSVTVRLRSLLISAQEQEEVKVVAEAGSGWTLSFEGSGEDDLREIVANIPNQSTMDLVLQIRANIGAGSTALELKAFPERRKLRVFRHTDVALAIGSQIVQGGTAIATLEFQGDLDPGNIDPVPRFFMFNPGRTRNFRIQNLSDEERTFALTITPEGSPIG